MLIAHRLRSTLAALLAGLVALPLGALAETFPSARDSDPAAVQPVDISLNPGGILHGYVVDGQGVAAGGVAVRLLSSDGQQVATRSDSLGRFGYRGLVGGNYRLETEYGQVQCRAWTAEAAPPRSAATLLLVHDEGLARGQWGPPPAGNSLVGQMKETMAHPFVVAAVIGAAVAIPVAIHNANQDDSGS